MTIGATWQTGNLEIIATPGLAGFNVVVAVNNNSAFSPGKELIDMLCRGNALGDPEQIYAFRKINPSRIAGKMRCLGIRVEKPNEIKPALAKAFVANRAVVVEAITVIEAAPEWSRPAVWKAQAGELAALSSLLILPVYDFAVD